ncbi:MAG: hypothetical protein JETT_2315 [Candidatus Jettenia ecosi]|uniref:Uncharacterized protein n=1 Tax=Candidatus Jettenia ecosi TaxID=2494326 RepID=A0A533Q9P7_9BACT|nr:MAG: hypothetical protein JETT_2315 [Candidatus Jettenia ecosi]
MQNKRTAMGKEDKDKSELPRRSRFISEDTVYPIVHKLCLGI